MRAFLDGVAGHSGALFLEGEPGIGKSTVWFAALAEGTPALLGGPVVPLCPAALAGVLGAKLWLEFLLGNGLQLELAGRAAALERQARSVRAVEGADLPLGAVLKAADRLDEARVRLEGVLAAIRKEQDDSSRFEVIVELGHLECLAGRWKRAEKYAQEAAEFAELTGQSELLPAVLALTAMVDALFGRLDQARANAQEGLAMAEASQATWFVLMNLPVLGYLELTAGRLTAAINREISNRMFISLRTTESTLSRVYRKLGVRSRAELARDFAARIPRL